MKMRNLLTICGVAAALMLSAGTIFAQIGNGGGNGGGGNGRLATGGGGGGGGRAAAAAAVRRRPAAISIRHNCSSA